MLHDHMVIYSSAINTSSYMSCCDMFSNTCTCDGVWLGSNHSITGAQCTIPLAVL